MRRKDRKFVHGGPMPESKCPSCAEELSAFTGASTSRGAVPFAGAPTICAYCGALLVFDSRLIPRKPTPEMAARLLVEYPLVRRLQADVVSGVFSKRGTRDAN